MKLMQQHAKAKGGECLSTEYINRKTKLRWRCAEGHEWEATSHHVKRGTWCGTCYRLRSIPGQTSLFDEGGSS